MGGARRDARGMNLFVFGLGYSALHYARHYGSRFSSIIGTVRDQAKAEALTRSDPAIEALQFDDVTDVAAHVAQADVLLVSIAPETHDPTLALYGDAIAAAPALRKIVYLSTIGVYGDHGGTWIDEGASLAPVSGRNKARVVAERRWLDLATPTRHVSILRLAGIYGPGRSQIDNLRAGTARRIVKEGQVFNRIHVADIARAIDACLSRDDADGIVNVTDDEPAPPQDVLAYAAGLLGMPPPPEIAFEDADFSPMARSFWGQNKRVGNQRMRETLGVELAYPTYREGLRALV
jgi:nucleoside-diphosphate-sugar epimerase